MSTFSCLVAFSVLAERQTFSTCLFQCPHFIRILRFITIYLKSLLCLIFIPSDWLHRKFLASQHFIHHLNEETGLYSFRKDTFFTAIIIIFLFWKTSSVQNLKNRSMQCFHIAVLARGVRFVCLFEIMLLPQYLITVSHSSQQFIHFCISFFYILKIQSY